MSFAVFLYYESVIISNLQRLKKKKKKKLFTLNTKSVI